MERFEFRGDKNIIHAQLRELRRRYGLTQGDLAARMQIMGVAIDQQMVSKIENNTRIVTDFELACLCKIFGVNVGALLGAFNETE